MSLLTYYKFVPVFLKIFIYTTADDCYDAHATVYHRICYFFAWKHWEGEQVENSTRDFRKQVFDFPETQTLFLSLHHKNSNLRQLSR